jgi:anti-sigma regulatory factor (Ser/Thr protein kinase)
MTETADTQRVQTQLPDLEITLPARAENVAVVRHAVGGLGEVLEVDDQTLSDIKLAVTEACTNVVVHAYPDGEGPMGLRASIDDRRLYLVVTDRGRSAPSIASTTPSSSPTPSPPMLRSTRATATSTWSSPPTTSASSSASASCAPTAPAVCSPTATSPAWATSSTVSPTTCRPGPPPTATPPSSFSA